MEFKYLNSKDEIVKIGDRIRTDIGFIGEIYQLEGTIAYVNIPTYYGPGGIQIQMDARKLKKYM